MVLRPLLSRVRLWPRFVLASGAVVAFAFVTRFEPSVLRAAAVAVIAVGARTIGRSGGGIRHLCLAVAALVVIDPLLTRSIGFRLSVAACAGVLLLAPRIAACVPGPRWFAEGLGVTAGAQLAVAPVLVPAFGPMPLAALPANVLAGPLAAFLMMWGVTAGMVAGAVGGEVAWLLHRPSALGLGALDRVAAGAAALPLGSIDLRHVLVVALCWACWWFLGRRGRATIVVLLCVALASAAVQPGARSEHLAGWGARVWTDGPVAVVALDPGASAVEVLDVVRRRHVSRVGAVVVGSDRPSLAVVADAIAARVPVGAVLVPEAAVHVDGVTPGVGEEIRVAGLSVVAERVTPTLRVRIGPARSG